MVQRITYCWLCLFSVILVAPGFGQNPDYGPLQNLLIQYYGYQRSGDKNIDNKNPFYKTSPFPHSTDALNGTDLSGGWYDAGDFVKFGLNFGFSVYCLLKGYDAFPRGYDDKTTWDYKGTPDGIPDILGEVKIATDYMQKAVISSSTIVVDVANADVDHGTLDETGYANSQRTSPRTVYTDCGADIAGMYAASLALMAQLYKPYDSTYAANCLAKARIAYAFGVAHPKLSTEQDGGQFYSTTTYVDKMACGAVELYRATKDTTFLNQALAYQAQVTQDYYVLGYADVGDLSSYDLTQLGYPVTGPWFADVALTMSRVVTAANASSLIKGAFINSDWGNAGNAACAGFSAALAFEVTGDTAYLNFARQQAHWVAGISPFTQSYVVGYGPNAPTAPSDRNDVALTAGPSVRLKGCVVSGPTPNGSFDPSNPQNSTWSFNGSDANNYKNTECAINYNAGMVGLLGFLRDYDNPPAGLVRINKSLQANPSSVDLTTQTDTISCTLASSMAWKVVLVGRISGAKRTVSGTGSNISFQWAGEADSGSFIAGENVDVTLDVPNIASYNLSRSKTFFTILALKPSPFQSDDVLVDDFEDNDTLNKVGGSWSIFTDKPTGQSSTNPVTMAPAIAAGQGFTATSGLSIRLIGVAGAAVPHAGIRTTFNSAGTAVSLGAASNVVFDIKATAGDSLWVELEQPGITDGAYFGKKINFVNSVWNRIRLPFGNFTQPAWKTSAGTLNMGAISALRFTYYGTSNIRFYLDNVYIEKLNIGGLAVHPKLAASEGGITQLQSTRFALTYLFSPPANARGSWTAQIYDVGGNLVTEKPLGLIAGPQRVSIPNLRLLPGLYFLRQTSPGATQEFLQKFLFSVNEP